MRTFTAVMIVLLAAAVGCGDDNASKGACSVDTDCKGDRICVGGVCVSMDGGAMDSGSAGTGGTGTGGTGGGQPSTCPNSVCDTGETCSSCPQDCGSCPTMQCGDGNCSEAECETCSNCPADCGPCKQQECKCGDGKCDTYYCGETCSTCKKDCAATCSDSGNEPGDVAGPQSGVFLCGNGVCEPGEDNTCSDCASAQRTCDKPCTNDCDCKQPWTACAVGARAVCTPVGCRQCYDKSLYCCWCPADVCGNVSCVTPGQTCPSC